VRVALWRALHLELDGQPPVLADPVGLRLADPADGWRGRPDMDPVFTRGFRAAIVARARSIEDLVTAAVEDGVGQYVLLGAGLDAFAQRRPEHAGRLRVFETDQPATLRQLAGLAPGSTVAMTFLLGHAVHQLLLPRRDDQAGPRGRLH